MPASPEPPNQAIDSAADEPRLNSGPVQVVVATRTLVALAAVTLGAVLLVVFVYSAREILIQLLAAIFLAMAVEPLVGVHRKNTTGAFLGTLRGVADRASGLKCAKTEGLL